MSNKSFNVTWNRLNPWSLASFKRIVNGMTIVWKRIATEITVAWRRVTETVVDLVPFSASDGMFLTNYGYTIIVKK